MQTKRFLQLFAVIGALPALAACEAPITLSSKHRANIASCERVIREAARWGVVSIQRPTFPQRGNVYTWQRGEIVLNNGFGARVDYSATCDAGEASTRVTLQSGRGQTSCTQIGDYDPICL